MLYPALFSLFFFSPSAELMSRHSVHLTSATQARIYVELLSLSLSVGRSVGFDISLVSLEGIDSFDSLDRFSLFFLSFFSFYAIEIVIVLC